MSVPMDAREVDGLEGAPLPEAQSRVVGHLAARAGFMELLAAGRLPGGMLVHGPRGIGKATLAFDMARQILLRTGDESPERIHEQVAAGAHPNVFVLRKAPRDGKGFYTVIRVEDVRRLREDIRMTRGRAGHRIAIIDSVDDCNVSSANALLKVLEEPPPETIFLLISHRPGQLLPTIKSRCHLLALRPLSAPETREAMQLIAPSVGYEEIERALAFAGGRPRRGYEALAIAGDDVLKGLRAWLDEPAAPGAGIHLALADALGADPASARSSFAREMILDALAREARRAAEQGGGNRRHLASANELWEKANSLFAEADSLNLDPRQTLIAIFDAIRAHQQQFSPQPATE